MINPQPAAPALVGPASLERPAPTDSGAGQPGTVDFDQLVRRAVAPVRGAAGTNPAPTKATPAPDGLTEANLSDAQSSALLAMMALVAPQPATAAPTAAESGALGALPLVAQAAPPGDAPSSGAPAVGPGPDTAMAMPAASATTIPAPGAVIANAHVSNDPGPVPKPSTPAAAALAPGAPTGHAILPPGNGLELGRTPLIAAASPGRTAGTTVVGEASPPARTEALTTATAPIAAPAAPAFAATAAHQSERTAISPGPAAEPPPLDQLSGRVLHAVRDGKSEIVVDLKPAELGRVEVRLIQEEGQTRLRIVADRAETFDLLKADLRVIERTLQDSGVRLDPGGSQLSLRSDGQRGHAGGAPTGGHPGGHPSGQNSHNPARPDPGIEVRVHIADADSAVDVTI